MYRLLRPLLFRVDAETAHESVIAMLAALGRSRSALRAAAGFWTLEDPRLEIERFGLRFPNPLGLAAGMDKDARAVRAWRALGFGFVEVGSLTALPQPGNPRPRLFRLPEEQALINRMGFNNDGAAAAASRLRELRQGGDLGFPLLVNVGKSRTAPVSRAAEDYRAALTQLWGVADALVINVSSPNTPGLRSLQDPGALDELLAVTDELARSSPRTILLKLAPDLDDRALQAIAGVSARHAVSGLVAVNTTVSRAQLRNDPGIEGGLSGRPLAPRSLEVLRFLRGATDLPLVSVGGIIDAAEAVRRLRAGASLLEIYTGFVYRGPGTASSLLRGILAHLEAEGIADVESLIGVDA